MRKVIVGTFVTLDGVMQGPGGPEEDREGGFTHGGWNAVLWDEMMGQTMGDQVAADDAILLGRKTYDIFVNFWPNQPAGDPTAAWINNAEKYVASRTLAGSDWSNTTVLRDAAADVAKLKEGEGRDLSVIGSGNLIQTLLGQDLVDRFILWVWPIVLGTGKRLFAEGTIPAAMKLIDCKVSTTGVTIQTFERDGDVKYGSFAG